jgi:hypothetical protein
MSSCSANASSVSELHSSEGGTKGRDEKPSEGVGRKRGRARGRGRKERKRGERKS